MRRIAEEAPQQWAMSSADRRVYDNVRWPTGAGGIMLFSLHDSLRRSSSQPTHIPRDKVLHT